MEGGYEGNKSWLGAAVRWSERLALGRELTTISAAPGKQFPLSGQGQHVRGPTGHLHHLITQQGLHNGGLERERKLWARGLDPTSPVETKLEASNPHEMAVSLSHHHHHQHCNHWGSLVFLYFP